MIFLSGFLFFCLYFLLFYLCKHCLQLIFFRIALFTSSFVNLKLNMVSIINRGSMVCLCISWSFIFILSGAVFIGIIGFRQVAMADGANLESASFLSPLNIFQSVVYNKCCFLQNEGVEVTLSANDETLDDYYYYFQNFDYSQVQAIAKCPENELNLNTFCARQPLSSSLSCACYNYEEKYDAYFDSFSSDNCVVFSNLMQIFFVNAEFTDDEICGYDSESKLYSPKLYQERFSTLLEESFYLFFTFVLLLSLVLFCTSCFGCVVTVARQKSLNRQKRRKSKREKEKTQDYYYRN